jgi:PatG Domain
MEQSESTEPAPMNQAPGMIYPSQDTQDASASCPTCGGDAASMPLSPVYALGRIEPRIPRLSVEKELAQAAGRADTAGKTDPQVFGEVLSRPENRYLVRQMCWVFTNRGLETYILQPRVAEDFSLLGARSGRHRVRPTSMSWSECAAPSRRPKCATGWWCRWWSSTRSIRSIARL